MLRALRPVGSSIPLRPTSQCPLPDLTCGGRYSVRFLDSGTSALAQALQFSRSRAGARSAILPAYGCPDLAAAAVYAALGIRLVDVEYETPFLSLTEVEKHVGECSAIVAANFMGMPERLDGLRGLASAAGIPLIEDSAQMAPFAGGAAPAGDLVVYSFGRGKPMSLLGGGALLIRCDWTEEFSAVVPAPPPVRGSALLSLAKRATYNLAIRPSVFALLRSIPALQLGKVEYQPLTSIEAMRDVTLPLLGDAYARTKPISAAQEALGHAMKTISDGIRDLPRTLGRDRFPLLRYPVLMEHAESREMAARRLARAGLGGSVLYGKSLADLFGMPLMIGGALDHARDFAARLITLPVHDDVLPQDIARMIDILGTA